MIPFRKTLSMLGLCVLTATSTTECSDAETATREVQVQADNFELIRELTLINTRTDRTLFHLTANFSINIDTENSQAEVICLTGEDTYERILLHLNDDVIYSVTDAEGKEDLSPYTFELEDFADCIQYTETVKDGDKK